MLAITVTPSAWNAFPGHPKHVRPGTYRLRSEGTGVLVYLAEKGTEPRTFELAAGRAIDLVFNAPTTVACRATGEGGAALLEPLDDRFTSAAEAG